MARKKRNFGFSKTKFDGTEHVFATAPQNELPSKYSYKKYLPGVVNQGSYPICVPCSVSSFINWSLNLKTGNKKDHEVAYFDIYDSKTTDTEGMTFKDAFKYLRKYGVDTDNGVFKIQSYALVKSYFALMSAIVMNGPCFGALPVYNWDDEFWIKNEGDNLIGYHAIAIVGYDDEGFIIRNSWGEDYGDNGYSKIKYEDSKKFVELWTVIE